MSLSERFLEQMRTRYAKINSTLSHDLAMTKIELNRLTSDAMNASNTAEHLAMQNQLLQAQQIVLLSLLEEARVTAAGVEELREDRSAARSPLVGLLHGNIAQTELLLVLGLLTIPSVLVAVVVGVMAARLAAPSHAQAGWRGSESHAPRRCTKHLHWGGGGSAPLSDMTPRKVTAI